MLIVFKNLWIVIVYVLGMISLAWHLMHGFQSAFQTFGLKNKKYKPIINGLGVIYTIVICTLFALMPVAIYLKWVN
jgi:succinate dehydrogenase / fumarate reductase cytochrome b subunit